MNILSNISKFIMLPLLIVNVALLVQIYRLPAQLNQGGLVPDTTDVRDTIIIEKQISLESKSDFFYAKGVCKKSFKISESYEYDTRYPEEIWNGYFTTFETANQKYLIWSHNEINNQVINGWFLTDNIVRFGIDNNETFVNVIYPVVRSKVGENNYLSAN